MLVAEYGDVFREIAIAARRPQAQILPALRDRMDFGRPTFVDMPHFRLLVNVARLYQLRAIAAAHEGDGAIMEE
ncbi:MAG: hypothetical protein ACI9UA_002215 [Pseudoalteromonas tetraodonis]